MRRPKKRQLSVFLLSFLDIMAGGFGAVVLIFLIVDHNTMEAIESANQEQLAQVRLLDFRVEDEEENLADVRELVGILKLQLADARKRVENIQRDVDETFEEVEVIERQALDQSETEEKLQSEIEQTEEDLDREQVRIESQRPSRLEVVGTGDRQYLTGLYLGGNHILIVLDSSASMLHDTIVNVVRLRNMSEEVQLNSKKWKRAVDTVEWFVANLPLDSETQIATFNEDAEFIIGDGNWHPASDGQALETAIDSLRKTPPARGTDLKNLFRLIGTMQPQPENVFLITDGLPTTDDSRASQRRTTVDGAERERLFWNALEELPAGITMNVILFPFEGDPWAAGAYWTLTYATAGTFMAPAKDWP